jgi:uncharacterized protein (DUF305 family)
MTRADMGDLKQATGADAPTMFLQGMTKHHQGATAKARDELKNRTTPRLESSPRTSARAQQAEIETVKHLRGGLSRARQDRRAENGSATSDADGADP